MLDSNFFYKFFRYKKNTSHNITTYNPSNDFKINNKIKAQLIEIDKEIAQNSKALFEAQLVKFRTTFSKSHNLIEKMGKNIYKNQIEESINWHQQKLKDLYFDRRRIQIQLEKMTGRFWINRIKRILTLLLLGFLLLLSIFILISGFLAMIYSLPFLILIFIIYIFSRKNIK